MNLFNDINNLSTLEQRILHTISDYYRIHSSSPEEIFEAEDGDDIVEEEISINEMPLEKEADWLRLTMKQLKSVFGEHSSDNIRNYAHHGAPFLRKSSVYAEYLVERNFITSVCSQSELKALENGGLLNFPAWMSTRNIHKYLRESGISLDISPHHRCKHIYGAPIFRFPGTGSRSRNLISARSWRDTRRTLYEGLRRSSSLRSLVD